MDYKEALCKQIELYFHDILEHYKVTNAAAFKDAKKVGLFKKTDFTGYIEEFEQYKAKALRLESMRITIPDEDIDCKLLAQDFRNSLLSFLNLCDHNIVFYDWNHRKQYKNSGVTVKGYAEVVNEMKKAMAEAVVDLDILERTYKKYCGDQPAEE